MSGTLCHVAVVCSLQSPYSLGGGQEGRPCRRSRHAAWLPFRGSTPPWKAGMDPAPAAMCRRGNGHAGPELAATDDMPRGACSCSFKPALCAPPPLILAPPPLAGAYPRQYYYDRLARTAFWTAIFAFVVMAAHLGALGAMMWRHAHVPGVMWFPRIETAVCLAILPGLAYGAAGGRGRRGAAAAPSRPACAACRHRPWHRPSPCFDHAPACAGSRRTSFGCRFGRLLAHVPPPPAAPLQACSTAAAATLRWASFCCSCCPSPSWPSPSTSSGAGCSTRG